MSNKKLKEVVVKMLQENTGRALCDSGDAYGRHFERNQKIKDFESLPVVKIELDEKYGKFYGSISLYHHLINSLEYDDEVKYVNRLFEKWDELHDFDSWEESMEAFDNTIIKIPRKKDVRTNWTPYDFQGSKFSKYTYNVENSLNQDFIYIVMGDWVFIQIHNGCDARGGFTRPRLFKFNDDLFSYDSYSIYCEENNHFWDKEGYDYYNTETDVDFKKIELKFKDGFALCPVCGSKLNMDKCYSG